MSLAKTTLLSNISSVLEESRGQIKQVVNHVMLSAYWEIGRLILEDEQEGRPKADYGNGLLDNLAS